MLEGSGKTILAVDDNITSLAEIRAALKGSFEISLAKSIEIALTILNTVNIDMILLDMNMPNVSGLEFLNFIQKHPSYYHIPVIIVSSHSTPDVILGAKQAGARDYVVKPVVARVLLDKIHTVLKTTPVKVPREIMLRKITLLGAACKQGKSARVEDMVKEMEMVYYSLAVDKVVAEIGKDALRLDYHLALEKIEKLLAGRLLENG
ncbi:MAG: response regulator [Treponema sp.]|jgi:PleD family two-component response regulator|nr:response regulator [Treponema sp.]